jgi:diguanylate cyclase (GGDEF)-like protein
MPKLDREIETTGLGRPNRTDLDTVLDTLNEAIANSTLSDTRKNVCLLLVRLRNFARLNVSRGYKMGDAAVSELGERLAGQLGDRSRVMRIGAGKFAVVLFGLKTGSHAVLAAKKIQRLAAAPVKIDGETLRVDIAQGMALHPENASSAEELLQSAEMALIAAQENEDYFATYHEELSEQLQSSSHIEASLLDALEDGGIETYFQSQVDLRTGNPCGAEALLRCRDKSGAFLNPEAVVDAAERSGKLLELTSIMLNVALRHAAEWPRELGQQRVAVNINAQSLREPDLVDLIASSLGIWGTDPDALTIEVTENALIDEPEKCFDLLRRIRDLGVRVAIDDFGTGYSSYSYFKDIPANELKIDKAFVLNLTDDISDRKIVRSVIALAHSFDLEVVAEGIEDKETYALLCEMGCDTAQGYWIGKPKRADEFLDTLKAGSKKKD